MACISPDGKPTESGSKMLRALQAGSKSPEEVAQETGLPLFRVRSGLRELAEAGLVSQKGDKYELSPKGGEVLGASST
jgi:predicted transcriptional regulator